MRPPRRIPGVALALALVLGFVLAACTGAPAPGPTRPGTVAAPGGTAPERPLATLRVGLGRDPVSLDPRSILDDEGELVVRAVFDGLVDVGPDGDVVPSAATWTVEDDGLTYRFVLREDRFHDGTPVTAWHHAEALLAVLDEDRLPRFREDLLTSVRGARADAVDEPLPAPEPSDEADAPLLVRRVRWGSPQDVLAAGGVEVVGRRELVIRLEREDPLLLYRLADPVLSPLPALAVQDPERFALEPIGNGPFRMAGPREPGAFVRLRAVEDHPAPPGVDALLLQIYPGDLDRTERWNDLVAGRLQIAAVPGRNLEEARERFGAPTRFGTGSGIHGGPLALLYAYGFVLDAPPFDDPDLRRAISAAVDRDALATLLSDANVMPAAGILPPTAGGAPATCAHCVVDVELADAAITAWRARLPEGTAEPRIVLNYPRGDAHVAVAERIASDLERTLGVEVRLQAREFGALVRAIDAGDAGLFRYGLRAGLGGRAAAVSLLSRGFVGAAEDNLTRWADPRTDELLAAWGPASPPELVRSVEQRLLDEAVVVPLLWTRADLAVHPDVRGFRMDLTGRWWPELVELG